MGTPINQLFDLTGRIALVTGGSRGLGLQIAEALGDAGARLMLTARKADELESACAQLQARGIDARWVAAEVWHPKQQASWLADGRYQLHIPYADARELLMDIQRHLPEVEIHSPPELKQALLQHLQQAMQQHEKIEK